jgi:hypothetical protein
MAGGAVMLTPERVQALAREAAERLFVKDLEISLAAVSLERLIHTAIHETLEAQHQAKSITSPDYCQGCGGLYRFDTSVDNTDWNAVIRAQQLPEYLCLACIAREFRKAGKDLTARLWGADFHGDTIMLVVKDAE